MHFLCGAEAYDRVCTHIFVAGDPYIESDAVFGVKNSLIVDFKPTNEGRISWLAEFDFVLKKD